jgi:hypothetical protein
MNLKSQLSASTNVVPETKALHTSASGMVKQLKKKKKTGSYFGPQTHCMHFHNSEDVTDNSGFSTTRR